MSPVRKTAKKTAISPRNGAEIPLGSHANNTGGKPGRSGRPSNEFREQMRQILENEHVQAAFMSIITNPEHPQFSQLWTRAAAYAYGLPPQKVELEGSLKTETGEQLMERILERLPRVIAVLPIEKRQLLEMLKRGREREVLVSGRAVSQRSISKPS